MTIEANKREEIAGFCGQGGPRRHLLKGMREQSFYLLAKFDFTQKET